MESKTVAIYIRVSTLDQAREGYSLDAQERILRKWCDDHKYNVYDLYADRGISAKDIEHRPDMTRLLQDAAHHKFDLVLFWALSRFTRSVSDLYITLEKFTKWNIAIASYTESFDTSTPMGRAMIGIVGVQGKAKIMFDMADNECWTDVFANDNDNEIYQSSTIVCVYSKNNFAGRNEKITFGKLMERIEEIDA